MAQGNDYKVIFCIYLVLKLVINALNNHLCSHSNDNFQFCKASNPLIYYFKTFSITGNKPSNLRVSLISAIKFNQGPTWPAHNQKWYSVSYWLRFLCLTNTKIIHQFHPHILLRNLAIILSWNNFARHWFSTREMNIIKNFPLSSKSKSIKLIIFFLRHLSARYWLLPSWDITD